MTNKIQVILVKAHWCPHCTRFMHIFNKARNDNNDKYEFTYYDFADDINFYDKNNNKKNDNDDNDDVGFCGNKDNFINNHKELYDLVEGYPTIFVKIDDDNKKHTIIEQTIIKNNDINNAVNQFIKNIEFGIKNIQSDNKIEYKNLEGGFCNINNHKNIEATIIDNNNFENKYKNKYMKYKEKYYKLKNNLL